MYSSSFFAKFVTASPAWRLDRWVHQHAKLPGQLVRNGVLWGVNQVQRVRQLDSYNYIKNISHLTQITGKLPAQPSLSSLSFPGVTHFGYLAWPSYDPGNPSVISAMDCTGGRLSFFFCRKSKGKLTKMIKSGLFIDSIDLTYPIANLFEFFSFFLQEAQTSTVNWEVGSRDPDCLFIFWPRVA